ncbi:MAG: hypothetical protein HQ582_25730 [Planctomycetes bacterium]|nr:hypothetical protein [Planctomycetota bacterium]
MPRSVLEAIKMGLWDFEPPEVEYSKYDCTEAMPGTKDKLDVLAQRVRCGLPLWHPKDRDEVPDEHIQIEEPVPAVNKPR